MDATVELSSCPPGKIRRFGDFNTSSPMTAAGAKLIFVVAVIASFAIRYPHQRRSRRIPVRTSSRDRPEKLLVWIAATGLSVVPLAYVATGFPRVAEYRFLPAFGWHGTLVFLVALWLFYRAHHDLGRNFSARLKVREGHGLVSAGVYARVRHPMYAAFWMWALAQTLLLPNWLVGPAGLAGFGVLFFCRVGREERMMLETFGEDYRAYMIRTKRIVPWLY